MRVNGELGLYVTGDSTEKEKRLADEGLQTDQGKVDVARYGFRGFSSTFPLAALSRRQLTWSRQTDTQREVSCPGRLAAVDVAYGPGAVAHAAYVEVDAHTGELLWSHAISQAVQFPYVPSYLAFRELPVLIALLGEVRRRRRLTPVVLVDGSGVLHPRRAGIATMLGIAEDIVTVGVTKKLLCGTFDRGALIDDGPQVISVDGEPHGVAMLARMSSGKPLFVSPGHQISWRSAGQIAASQRRGHRLLEPIYWADRICGQHARREEVCSENAPRPSSPGQPEPA